MRFDTVALGELLIDFTPCGKTAAGIPLFAQNPGGAPANVLAANTGLGGKTAFIGKVGRDGFGSFLKNTLQSAGICTDGLIESEREPTTLVFVQLDEHGDRAFRFYRRNTADVMLEYGEIDPQIYQNTKIMHFGSASLTGEPSRTATLATVRAAKQSGAIISYDPNFREPIWDSRSEAITQMKAGLRLADIVKISFEELALLTGESDLLKGADCLRAYGACLVLVTLGAKGAFYRANCGSRILATYDVATIDTNGAGDAFMGAIHFRLRNKTLDEIKAMVCEELDDIVDFANAAGSLATTKSGAIPAMPTLAEVEQCRAVIAKCKNIEP